MRQGRVEIGTGSSLDNRVEDVHSIGPKYCREILERLFQVCPGGVAVHLKGHRGAGGDEVGRQGIQGRIEISPGYTLNGWVEDVDPVGPEHGSQVGKGLLNIGSGQVAVDLQGHGRARRREVGGKLGQHSVELGAGGALDSGCEGVRRHPGQDTPDLGEGRGRGDVGQAVQRRRVPDVAEVVGGRPEVGCVYRR